MKRKKFPLKIKRGNTVVTVYKSQIAGKLRYRVCYYENECTKYVAFSDPASAEKHANEVADKLTKNEVNILTFSRADHDEYMTSLEHLKRSGIPLRVAASLIAQVTEILGDQNLILQAVHYYAHKFPSSFPDKSVAEVKDEFMQYQHKVQNSARYVATLRYHLDIFANHFQCPIRYITHTDLNLFLEKLGRKSRTINNFIGTIKTFFKFAQKRGYLPRDHDDAARLETLRQSSKRIEVWSSEELMRLLRSALIDLPTTNRGISKVARRAYLPCMTIGAFAGLRSQEIERLDWQDVKMNDGVILVRDCVGGERNKTGKRTAPLLPNLRAWLEPFAEKSGRIWPFSHEHYYDTQRCIAEFSGADEVPPLPWRHNSLRHSFISYRVQLIGNRYTVAEEAGNSPQMIKKHYLEMELGDGSLITKKEAVNWFSIFPDPKLQPIIKNDPHLLPKLLPAVAA